MMEYESKTEKKTFFFSNFVYPHTLVLQALTSVYVYVRYLLEVFSRFEDPRARFGHRGVALISDRGAAEVTN